MLREARETTCRQLASVIVFAPYVRKGPHDHISPAVYCCRAPRVRLLTCPRGSAELACPGRAQTSSAPASVGAADAVSLTHAQAGDCCFELCLPFLLPSVSLSR